MDVDEPNHEDTGFQIAGAAGTSGTNIIGAAERNGLHNLNDGSEGLEDLVSSNDPFYVRYYAGHRGKFGHEFLEFDVRLLDGGSSGVLRYANNSNYRNDTIIRKEVEISNAVINEIKKIISDSEIMLEDDKNWPEPNRNGTQELEVRLGKYHISFETAKLGSLNDVQNSDDAEGLRVFHYLVQDLKALIFSLITLHFKIKPV